MVKKNGAKKAMVGAEFKNQVEGKKSMKKKFSPQVIVGILFVAAMCILGAVMGVNSHKSADYIVETNAEGEN